MNNFTEISLSSNNLDLYYVRTSILNALRNNLPDFKGRLLDIGCGKMPYKDYILQNSLTQIYVGLDIENAIQYDKNVKPDYYWDGKQMPFPDNSFETAFGTEVLEHCPYPQVILDEVNRVLKPGGAFFFTVPFLWNLHETPYDEYRYTPFALERLLRQSGFTQIKLEALGGWHASMAQMLGLWVCRAPIEYKWQKILKKLIFPIYKLLLRKDKKPTHFNGGYMITGLSGIAYKQ